MAMFRGQLITFLVFGIFFTVTRCVYVNTRLGPIRGTTMLSRNGYKFNAFLGIPYAKPPIGELRFRVSVHLWAREKRFLKKNRSLNAYHTFLESGTSRTMGWYLGCDYLRYQMHSTVVRRDCRWRGLLTFERIHSEDSTSNSLFHRFFIVGVVDWKEHCIFLFTFVEWTQ